MKKPTTRQIVCIFAGILTLAVLSCSGTTNVSNFFATDTPTPTNTFTPSPTLTPSPTSTPTRTPSPSRTPAPTQTNMKEQADGSTLYTDNDNGYQLALPQGWFILPFSSDDIADILQSMSEDNPDFKEMAEGFKNLDPDIIRVMALNMDSKYMRSGASPSLSVIAIDNQVMTSMPLEFVVGALEESFKQQGAEVLSTNSTLTNANGVEMGSFDYIQSVPSPTGSTLPVRYKAIIFRAGDKMIMVQLGSPKEFGEVFLPVMDQITDSVKLIEE